VPLDPATLASGIETMTPTSDEQSAIAAFANAWSGYFAGSTVSGVPAVPGSFDPALAAMRGAMVGMSKDNAGALAIQAGITAFWGAIAALPATIWPLAPAIVLAATVPPTTLSLISTALVGAFATNAASGLSLHDAANAIALLLHNDGGVGATVTGATSAGSPVTLPII
jgi:hypothetical protein